MGGRREEGWEQGGRAGGRREEGWVGGGRKGGWEQGGRAGGRREEGWVGGGRKGGWEEGGISMEEDEQLDNGGSRGLAEHEGDDMRGGQRKRMNRVGRKEWSMGGGGGKVEHNTEANVGITLVNRICSQTGGIVIKH